MSLHPEIEQFRRAPIYAETNSAWLPSFHRLDLRISKSITFRHWRLNIFFAVFNAYNRKNVLSFFYEFGEYIESDHAPTEYEINALDEPVILPQLPRIPYLGITAEF